VAGQRTNEWKLGLFVVTGLAVGFGALLWLGANRFEREIIPAFTYIDESVQGLDIGSPVKFRGVTIGTVAGIGVAPDHRHVEVRMHIYADVLSQLGLRAKGAKVEPDQPFVPQDVRVQLASAGITGVKFLAIDRLDPERRASWPDLPGLPFVVPWNYVPAAPSTLKNIEGSVLKLAHELPDALDDARAFMKEGRHFLADLDAKRLSAQTQETIAEARQVLESADHAISSVDAEALNQRLDSILTGVDRAVNRIDGLAAQLETLAGEGGEARALIADLRATTATVREAIERADAAATTASVRDAAGSVGRLSRDLGAVSGELQQALIALREAADRVAALAQMLERDPGSLMHGRSEPGGRE
jgi:phospholipid/cholesterol/gamma-HCH transport system substrate-binding protein